MHSDAPAGAVPHPSPVGRSAGIGALALCGLAFTALPAGAAGRHREPGGLLDAQAGLQRAGQDFAKTKAGAGVTVSPSFGPSGTQATSVVDGLPADVVNFSLEPDMAKVVKAGLVSSSWDNGPDQGHGDRLHRLVHRAARAIPSTSRPGPTW